MIKYAAWLEKQLIPDNGGRPFTHWVHSDVKPGRVIVSENLGDLAMLVRSSKYMTAREYTGDEPTISFEEWFGSRYEGV